MLAPSISMAESVTATSTRIAAVGRANTGTASRASACALGRRLVSAENERDADDRNGNHQRKMELRRHAELRDAGAAKPGAEKADAPERMRAVHDPLADQVLGAVGLDVEDDSALPIISPTGSSSRKKLSGSGA